jgi:hypothetical protein
LEPDNEGIWDDPTLLVLKLVEQEPDGVTAEVITPVDVEGGFDIPQTVTRVDIRNIDISLAITDLPEV